MKIDLDNLPRTKRDFMIAYVLLRARCNPNLSDPQSSAESASAAYDTIIRKSTPNYIPPK